jgi:hypothetical protein
MATKEKMMGWIQDLWEIGANGRYGYRMPGTPAGLAGAAYVHEKLKGFGLSQVRTEQAGESLCLPDTWRLTAHAPQGDRDVECSFIRYSAFTPKEGVKAPLVYLGEGREADFASADVKGKIVLVDLVAKRAGQYPPMLFTHDPDKTMPEKWKMEDIAENWPVDNRDESYKLAGDHGAVGYIGILRFSTDDNSQYLHWYVDGSIPALTISPDSGKGILEQLQSSHLEATMVHRGVREQGPIHHVFGSVPGKCSDSIIIHTHHDGWAVNEASGVAVVLALAEYFAKAKPNHNLQFVFFDSHFGKKTAMPESWEKLLGTTRAALIIEMIGKHYRIVDGKYQETGLVAPTVFCLSNGAEEYVDPISSAIVRHGLKRSAISPITFGEGTFYSKKGIPSISRISHNAPQFSNEDTPDKVMSDALEPTVAAFADIINAIDE